MQKSPAFAGLFARFKPNPNYRSKYFTILNHFTIIGEISGEIVRQLQNGAVSPFGRISPFRSELSGLSPLRSASSISACMFWTMIA
jgi:hypothetical protein